MYSTVSYDLIGQMLGAPVTLIFLSFPVLIAVIVAATLWTRR